MTRALPRTNFNSSRLIRFLADLSVEDAAESKQAFAERLGEWLDFSDAIALSGALGNRVASLSAVSEQTVARRAVEETFARHRAALANSITKSCSPGGETRIKLPLPKPGAAIEIDELVLAYEPYRRFYLAHQREMEAGVRPLRVYAREAAARTSPALRQLATLDASLDKIFGDRERVMLATVPSLLEKRFAQWLTEHQRNLSATRQADDSALWMAPGGWLAGFCKDLQAVLLAELEVRLQPTLGLIEAFSNEANQHK